MAYKNGKFSKPGDKQPPKKDAKKGSDEKEDQQPQNGEPKPKVDSPTEPQGEQQPTDESQPHPTTGVRAFDVHHLGGGQYRSHTKFADGQVEIQDHPDAASVREAADQAFPPDQQELPVDNALGGIAGGIGGGDGQPDNTDY